jgi:hypothetical protein
MIFENPVVCPSGIAEAGNPLCTHWAGFPSFAGTEDESKGDAERNGEQQLNGESKPRLGLVISTYGKQSFDSGGGEERAIMPKILAG